jgi:4-amino-4-deoxy-L-arabinose transferase-like glycosyltransferase
MLLLQITSARKEAQTWDEAVYISAGYSYWKTGDFRLNPEHPPLAKLLAAVPLLFGSLDLPLEDPAWKNSDEYAFGARFLYDNRLPADTILFLSRCTTIFLTLLFGLTISLWTKRRAGMWAGLVALTLFAFDPNIIAHGRYATNDLPLAFFFFLAVVLWNRALRRSGSVDYAFAGCALGAALSTKLSALALVPIFALLTIGHTANLKAFARGVVFAALAAVVVIGLLYHGELYRYRDLVRLSLDHARGGQLAYLFGSTFKHGRWYFYPAVAVVKTPVGVFLLMAVAVVAILRRKGLAADSRVVPITAAVYAASVVLSPIDLGIRVLLPLYPLLYIFLALNLPLLQWRWLVVAPLALVIAESLMVYPNYLAFFNAFVGGPAQGPRFLLDSNIDWGQDTKKLKEYMQVHDMPAVCTAYFGMAYPAYYGIAEIPWVGYVNADNVKELNCVLAVSVTWLYGGPAIAGPTWGWLRSQPPTARVGYSIYVYDFRHRRPRAGK